MCSEEFCMNCAFYDDESFCDICGRNMDSYSQLIKDRIAYAQRELFNSGRVY